MLASRRRGALREKRAEDAWMMKGIPKMDYGNEKEVWAYVARLKDGKEILRWTPGATKSEIERDTRQALSFLGRPVRVMITREWHTLCDGAWID